MTSRSKQNDNVIDLTETGQGGDRRRTTAPWTEHPFVVVLSALSTAATLVGVGLSLGLTATSGDDGSTEPGTPSGDSERAIDLPWTEIGVGIAISIGAAILIALLSYAFRTWTGMRQRSLLSRTMQAIEPIRQSIAIGVLEK